MLTHVASIALRFMSTAPFHSFSSLANVGAIGISLDATSVRAFSGRPRKTTFLIAAGAVVRRKSRIPAAVSLLNAGRDIVRWSIALNRLSPLFSRDAVNTAPVPIEFEPCPCTMPSIR